MKIFLLLLSIVLIPACSDDPRLNQVSSSSAAASCLAEIEGLVRAFPAPEELLRESQIDEVLSAPWERMQDAKAALKKYPESFARACVKGLNADNISIADKLRMAAAAYGAANGAGRMQLLAAASDGDSFALFVAGIGGRYNSAIKGRQRAFRMLNRAADQGLPIAMLVAGTLHHKKLVHSYYQNDFAKKPRGDELLRQLSNSKIPIATAILSMTWLHEAENAALPLKAHMSKKAIDAMEQASKRGFVFSADTLMRFSDIASNINQET